MRNTTFPFFVSWMIFVGGGLVSPSASATTKAEALAMAPGIWPAHLECTKNEDGSLTGQREEEIVVTDAPGEGNVLTRTFADPTCNG